MKSNLEMTLTAFTGFSHTLEWGEHKTKGQPQTLRLSPLWGRKKWRLPGGYLAAPTNLIHTPRSSWSNYFTEMLSNSILWISVVSAGSCVPQGKDKVTTRFKYSITTNYTDFWNGKMPPQRVRLSPAISVGHFPEDPRRNHTPGSPMNDSSWWHSTKNINKPAPGIRSCVLL